MPQGEVPFEGNTIRAGISFSFKLFGTDVYVTDAYNLIQWKHTKNWAGWLAGSDVLGSNKDGRWLAIFGVPNYIQGENNGALIISLKMTVYIEQSHVYPGGNVVVTSYLSFSLADIQ